MSLAGLLLSLTYRQVGHGVMSSSLSEAATYEPERKYLEKRRGKLFSFLQAAGLSRFFYFFLWKPPCCLGCQVDCNCMFFFSERPRCLSSQPGEVVQWRRHRRRFSLCLQGYSEKDDSGHKKKQTRVLWHETHTHTHSLTGCIKGRLRCFVVQ